MISLVVFRSKENIFVDRWSECLKPYIYTPQTISNTLQQDPFKSKNLKHKLLPCGCRGIHFIPSKNNHLIEYFVDNIILWFPLFCTMGNVSFVMLPDIYIYI